LFISVIINFTLSSDGNIYGNYEISKNILTNLLIPCKLHPMAVWA
jgi:hypothetical protein